MSRVARFACAAFMCWAAHLSAGQDAGDQLFIIPTPKRIRLAEARLPLVVEGRPAAAIVLAKECSRQAEIGANEINHRLGELGAPVLPVVSEQALSSLAPGTSLILVGQPGENRGLARECERAGLKLDPADPGPQGYNIRFAHDGARGLALLAGSDAVGMLYACVTFRHLIRGDGRSAYALAAEIRDWPDVRWRFTWTTIRTGLRTATAWGGRRPPAKPEEGLRQAKRQIDWFLRHKVNIFRCEEMLWSGQQLKPWNRQVLAYAFERGIWGWGFGAKGCLGEAEEGKPKPELDVCFAFKRRGTRYWCWSRDEMMQRYFEQCARTLAESLPEAPGHGGLVLVIHMPDTGNMGWHERCQQCRARFGNDQGAAQANVFTHFHRAMRKFVPRSKLVLVPRPYVLFDFDAPENRVYRERFETLAKGIPADSYLVHVGGTREAVESWQRVCKPVRLAHWVNSRGHGELDVDFRLNKTYYLGPHDIYFQGSAYPGGELEVLGAVESMWHVNMPGAVCVRSDRELPYTLKPWSDVADTREQVRKHRAAFSNVEPPWRDWQWLPLEQKAGPEVMRFLGRAARHLYGDRAAPHLLRVQGSGCIRWYGLDPSMYPSAAAMRSQVQGLDSAAKAAEALAAQKIGIPDLFGEGESTFQLWRVLGLHADLAKARVWTHVLDAQESLAKEQWTHVAECLAQAEAALAAGRQALPAACGRLKPLQRYRGELPESRLAQALAALSDAEPKLEVLKIESQLRRGLERFRPRAFRGRYTKGDLRVAVYFPPQDKGDVIGAEGICEALRSEPGVHVARLPSLDLAPLLRYHCLILPSCRKMPAEDLAAIPGVRTFVGQHGGGVYVQHSSVGHPRFPLHASMFPEVCQYAGRAESNRVTVAATRPVDGLGKAAAGDRLPNFEMSAHALVRPHQVGQTLVHMYYDHMTLGVAGRTGVPVLVDAKTKAPVVVAGQVGRGRVVIDGTIALASPRTAAGRKLAAQMGKDLSADNFEHPAFGLSRELLLNGVRWLCGK